MDVGNSEEPIYQYYTIVDDQLVGVKEEDEDKSVIYLTFGQNGFEDDGELSQTTILTSTADETPTVDIPNFKVISFADGQIYVTDENEENLTAVQPEILCQDESMLSTTNELAEEPEDNDEEFQEIKLEDGTSAIIGKNLWSSIIENARMKTQDMRKRKKYPCMYVGCDKVYTTAQHLTVHIRSHTGVKPYHCTEEGCGKSFTKGYSLKAHIRTHTGEKPYACTACTKQFKTSGDLQKHIRTHTGEKPFTCPIEGCGRSFTTSNIRKVHIRSHTGERPYVCEKEMCGKAFASATNYKNHMRIHSGEKPYVCSVPGCDKRFTEYSSLYKHNMVHKPYKPFKCDYCGQLCKQENTLKAHKRTIHGVIVTPDGTEIIFKKEDYPGVVYEISKDDQSDPLADQDEADEEDE